MSQNSIHTTLATVAFAAGVLLTWSQVDPLAGWRPTFMAHVGMGLAAAGVLSALARQVLRRDAEG